MSVDYEEMLLIAAAGEGKPRGARINVISLTVTTTTAPSRSWTLTS